MAGAVRPAMQIAVFGSAALDFLAAGGARRGIDRRRERRENRIEMLHDLRLAADHLTEAALEAPYAAAGARIDVVNSLRRQRFGAPDVVDVVRIAAVNDDVVALESAREIGDRLLDHRRRHHHPCDARQLELGGEVVERRRADRALLRQFLDRIGAHVEHDAFVTAAQQTPHHIRTHSAQADHSHLHV